MNNPIQVSIQKLPSSQQVKVSVTENRETNYLWLTEDSYKALAGEIAKDTKKKK